MTESKGRDPLVVGPTYMFLGDLEIVMTRHSQNIRVIVNVQFGFIFRIMNLECLCQESFDELRIPKPVSNMSDPVVGS